LIVCLAALLNSCTGGRAPIPEAPAALLSAIDVGDPKANVQLVHGFWKIEGGGWRWTAGKFSVVLQPPPGAASQGARLSFDLNFPRVIIDKLGPVTLSASVNGMQLPQETYRETGDKTYVRDVPAAALP